MFSNNMTLLLDFIEKKLGLIPLRGIIPAPFDKNSWAKEVIENISLVTFSTYYPLEVPYRIDATTKKKNDWYYIDEDKIGGPNTKIIGCKDISWETIGRDGLFFQVAAGYGQYDAYAGAYSVEDVMIGQMRADISSLYNYNMYPKFEDPNKFKIEGLFASDITKNLGNFSIKVLVMHNINLLTIPTSKMEFFKALCVADVADYLVANLEHFENIETVYAQVQLKLDRLRDYASQAISIREQLQSSFVSADNGSIPCIMAI